MLGDVSVSGVIQVSRPSTAAAVGAGWKPSHRNVGPYW